jgi:energy-coupling factor transporter transmembrane protein EcfT
MGKNVVSNMERSERLYESLKMRGFTGKITFLPRKLKVIDYLIIVLTLGSMVFIAYFIKLEPIYQEVMYLFLPLK